MSIRAGQLVYLNNQFIIDRAQSASANLQIPEETITEIGNYQSLAVLRDIPDLTWEVMSYDVSTKMEALISGLNASSTTAGEQFAFTNAVPFNVLSAWRSSQNFFNVINGMVLPSLYLDSVAYRFGVGQDAGTTYGFRGDTIYYTPGTPFQDTFTSNGTTTSYTLTNTAQEYVNTTTGQTEYVLNINVYNTNGTTTRLFNGPEFDYTDSPTGFTFNAGSVPPNGAQILVQYSTAAAESISQAQNTADGITVKPSAIKAKDIDVYVGTTAATPTFARWTGVQSFDCTWNVNLDRNEEFGNPNIVSQDYVIPAVSGTITTRDQSVTTLFAKISQATNVPVGQVMGPLSSTPVPVEIRLSDPTNNGAPLKTIYIPDARFEPPSVDARANQKIETPFKFSSDTGSLYVYQGERPGSPWQIN